MMGRVSIIRLKKCSTVLPVRFAIMCMAGWISRALAAQAVMVRVLPIIGLKLIRIIPCPENAEVQCEQCHMPLTVMNGGGYTLHSHRAGIIPPDETRKSGVPNSCANGGCHEDKSIDWLQAAFDKNYRVVEGR